MRIKFPTISQITVVLLIVITYSACHEQGTEVNVAPEKLAFVGDSNSGTGNTNNSTEKNKDIALPAVDKMSDLPAFKGTGKVFVKGYYKAGDGGGGNFVWDPSSSQQPAIGWVISNVYNAKGRWKRMQTKSVTPEMFGATGDGSGAKLETKYKTLDDAKKDYPGVMDLKITLDGAAFQKAVDVQAEKGGGEVIASNKYLINYPIETKDNVTIDGKKTGYIRNDGSRSATIHGNAFFLGNHHSIAFNTNKNQGSGQYILYRVAAPIKAGQDYVQLADNADMPAFTKNQLIIICSEKKQATVKKFVFQPYHITIGKIMRKENGKLYLEHPIDEDVSDPQIAANGGMDAFSNIKFGGVANVTIRNFTIEARTWANRWYGYNCLIENLNLVNNIDFIDGSALAYSTIRNITGNFSRRCIEIKTGTHDLVVSDIDAVYKNNSDPDSARSAISLGEYNRNIVIKNFKIDLKELPLKFSIISLQARKAKITNGTIICKNHKTSFINFFNDNVADKEEHACYKNEVSYVTFIGNKDMPLIMAMGNDKPGELYPSDNLVDHCKFIGGTAFSNVALNAGHNNKITNSTFKTKRFVSKRNFSANNVLQSNTTEQQ